MGVVFSDGKLGGVCVLLELGNVACGERSRSATGEAVGRDTCQRRESGLGGQAPPGSLREEGQDCTSAGVSAQAAFHAGIRRR